MSSDPLELAVQRSETKCELMFIDGRRYRTVKPYYISRALEGLDDDMRTNLAYDCRRDVVAHDLRGLQDRLTLAEHGIKCFSYAEPLPLSLTDHDNLEQYMETIAETLKNELDAELVLCYDYRFRSSSKEQLQDLLREESEDVRFDEPANSPHVDHTAEGGLRRARRHFTTAESEKFLDGSRRIRIMNMWRPLTHEVTTAPFAFCDRRLVGPGHLIAADRVSRDYIGEVYYLTFDPTLKWFYLGGQTPKEAFLFVSFDSSFDGGEIALPHASLCLLETPMPSKPRHSLETRMIVVSKAAK